MTASHINAIMSSCSFSSTTYLPSKTTAAMGLTIVAQIPTLTSTAGINGFIPSGVVNGNLLAPTGVGTLDAIPVQVPGLG
jgi:hypothetical protein